MLLAIDIGNSNITLGVFDGDELIFSSRLDTQRDRTEDQYAVELMSIFSLKGVSKEKIDGIVAAIMALDRCIRNQVEPQGSVYDERGLLVL